MPNMKIKTWLHLSCKWVFLLNSKYFKQTISNFNTLAFTIETNDKKLHIDYLWTWIWTEFHFVHLLKSRLNHSIIDTSEDPRKSPRNPPTAEIRPSWFMTKYSFLVSMVKSTDLNLRKNFPATNCWFCLVANNLAFSCLFLRETSKLEVLQGLIHLDGFLEEYKIVARCTLWRLWFSWSLVRFLQMLVSLKYFPILSIAEEHS